jgi:GNAT superfamily N-acetyltransferase
MPSANFCVSKLVVSLYPVRTLDDAELFIRTRTANTHQLGTDRAKILKRLRGRGRLAFVVKDGMGLSLGTASITESEAAIGVVGIALLPEAQGKGYGRLILRQLELIAAEHGYIALRADIFDDNNGAIALFSRSGYRRYSLFEKPIPAV